MSGEMSALAFAIAAGAQIVKRKRVIMAMENEISPEYEGDLLERVKEGNPSIVTIRRDALAILLGAYRQLRASETDALVLQHITPEIATKIGELEFWREASRVRELPPDATLKQILQALLQDATDGMNEGEEQAHFLSNISSWVESEIEEIPFKKP
jgi:hypothetical protein